MRFPLIKVAPKPDVPVGEGENGLGLRQDVEVEFHLADTPLLDRESRMFDHRRPPSSVMLEKTMSAPWRCSASAWPRPSTPVQKSTVLFGK